ncbi:MAG TPA: PKD domain-containing protein, partial [Thermoplasmata archaeon]|nr:PKD domain-containing protein [Thermoplasmata archaeon]
SPGVPTTGSVDATHVYGDNGAFPVTATICDDDLGCGQATLTVTVNNVAPTITDVQAYVIADLTVRVAGEKWHDVRMDILWNNNLAGSAHLVRYPGSPDRQSGTIAGGHLQLLGDFRIVLYYTPADDPVNGQPNGANPVWVILTMPDGSEVRLHHNFNVQHPSTWTWTIDDLRPYLVGRAITFDATAHDVGSDDLTFAWSFGDGSPDLKTTFYNNGVSPDPYVSPEVNPITAHDLQAHGFAMGGTYMVTLTVTDDDGGVVARTFTITVG